MDVSDGSSEATSKAINTYMGKIDIPGYEKITFSGSVSDTGGDGNSQSGANGIRDEC